MALETLRSAVLVLHQDLLHPSRRILFAIKLVAFASFLLATNGDVGSRSFVGYAFYLFAWAISLLALFHIAFITTRRARIAWTIVIALSTFVGRGFRVIYDTPITLVDLDKLVANITDVDTVWPFYGRLLLGPLLYSLLGAVAINLPPFLRRADGSRLTFRRRASELGLQIAPLAIMVVVLFVKHGDGTNGLAVQQTSAAFLGTLGIERVLQGRKPLRQEVRIPAGGRPGLKNIIVIMDESTRGDWLDLNREQGALTGLDQRPGVVNFGVMSSIANCSHETNVSLRFGIGRGADYLKQLATHPSLWAYGKKAGYRTYYLDAQRANGVLQNGMDQEEHALIDEHIQVGADVIAQDRDVELAKILRRVLSEHADQGKVLYLQKMGSHFPYEGKYPPDQALREPTMAREYTGTEADPSQAFRRFRKANTMDVAMRSRMKNSYFNSVSWNTSQFFKIVLDGIDLSSTVIVYMADHGQDFRDDGRPGMNTHCTPTDAYADEGRVPLVVITTNPEASVALRASAVRNINRMSQFMVFPSVLGWMGYAKEAVRSVGDFDPAVDEDPLPNAQQFLSTFFVRLGGKPFWNPCSNHRPGDLQVGPPAPGRPTKLDTRAPAELPPGAVER